MDTTAAVPPDKQPPPSAARPSQPAEDPSHPDPPSDALAHTLDSHRRPPSSAGSLTAAPAMSASESVDGRRVPEDDEGDDEGSKSAEEGETGRESGSGSGSGTSPDVKEDSGGAGNETDVEDEDGAVEDDSLSPPDFPPPVLPPARGGATMYPFPSTSTHHRRPSSLEGEVMSSATSSSSLDSSERRRIGEPLHKGARLRHPVPRLRRIGALGISVHSDSDPDDPNVSGLDSFDRRVEPTADSSTGDTRATDLGISSNELRTSGGGASPSKKARKRRVVADATFRGIVDELAVQNRELRDRLKRYEAEGVPTDVKQDRLFEIRFFDALPPEKRFELENYLTRYVQDYVHGDTPSLSDAPLSALPSHLRPSNIEDPSLAGPSNSGLEPVSLSGTGSSMRLPPSHPHLPTLKATVSSNPAPITSPGEETKAREIVSALESLFQQSLLRTLQTRSPHLPPHLPRPSTASDSGSNTSYLSNLLSHDFLSQGYVYLNLAFTMAQLHRFSVTVGFVQRAVRQFSGRLELSQDGNRIRWRGSGSGRAAVATGQGMPTLNEDQVAETSSLSSSNQSRPLPREGREPSSKDTLVSSSSGGDSTSRSGGAGTGGGGTSLLKNSQAASSGTGATSRFSSSGGSKEGAGSARPVRPSAAVLQPMDRFHGVETDEAGQVERKADGARGASAPAYIPGQPTSPRRRVGSPHKAKDTSSADGQSVLSAANLHEHDRLDREEASASASAGASAGASDKAVRSPPRAAHDSFDSTDPRQAKGGTGTLVFYGNGAFCTDLSKEDEPVTPPLLPKVAVEMDEALGTDGGKKDSDKDDGAGEVSVVAETEDSDVNMLAVNDGLSPRTEPSATTSDQDGSANSSLLRLRASGMTTTIPADLFTVVVQTRHRPLKRDYPFPSPDSPENATNRLATSFPFFPPDAKRIRLDTYSPTEIVSTKEILHNPRSRERVQLAGLGLMSDDSGGEGEDGFDGKRGWRYGHELTSSNLAKHARQPPPSIYIAPPAPYLPASPSPPDDDYLLSLSAPSHSWAPRESGFHSSAASSGRGFVTSFLPGDHRRLVGPLFVAPGSGITGLSTGDEKPISLDEAVEVGDVAAS
ncbi:hypothetical protein NBRC10513_007884 [Rhodotorula toruloides]|uniref:BY PROTMAP: gi/472581655/gb/EMS19378.1/ Frequency clock protein [Rhodosporidium toruloides NP11] gi/647398382/emb/CDR42241.1/ RHTO0S06e11408g1_1 [Rhodosporidium toruloides] n=1 Tax=Rhodotorula toruloides TaxID=5286 RepID=A0A0K3CGP7_RHOTO|nr:hypothetical protein AAT19DRAFT_13473 [Rhodotorula toruloides]